MNKKYLLFVFLLVANSDLFSMNSHEGSGWISDDELPRDIEQCIRDHIDNKNLGPAGRMASQMLRSIEENPHSSDSSKNLEAIQNIQSNLMELASFKGQSNSPIFRNFTQRVSSVAEVIRQPSTSPVRRAETKNEDENFA
jgi:hypothetical protein